jgi:hypothetical protein
MSVPSTRRRRRGNHDTSDASHGATTVTLNSREFIEKLLREYVDNTNRATTAKDAADKAFKDAARFEQQVADLATKEQAALAKIQQAQTELQQVQTERQETSGYAEKAREYGTSQMVSHDSFAGQAADARTVLESFQIAIPDQPGKPELAAAQAGVDPAGPTRVDMADDDPLTGPATTFALTPDPKINDSVDRLMHHHDTDPAGEAGVA